MIAQHRHPTRSGVGTPGQLLHNDGIPYKPNTFPTPLPLYVRQLQIILFDA
jgi:hypothetical protein